LSGRGKKETSQVYVSHHFGYAGEKETGEKEKKVKEKTRVDQMNKRTLKQYRVEGEKKKEEEEEK
jgi:hypothetical protein